MDWKKFLKPTKIKFAILVILFILSIFFGFIRTDLTVNLCTGPDCPPQRECGVEGIFNPLLRPISFVLANIVQGLLMNDDIVLCGGGPAIILFWPLDIPYLYVLSCFAVSIFRRYKK